MKTMKLKINRLYFNGLRPKPNDKIAINSLSLLNFIKHKSNPKINIKGVIMLIKFGIR